MKILRTDDRCFENLPDYPFAPHYTEVPDGEGGKLRIHHLDEGPKEGPGILCLHGQPTWSYLYRHMIPILNASGLRVLAPDLVGYGRSDKPTRLEDYTYQNQVDWFNAWLVQNDLQNLTFFGQDWGGLIGLRLVAENPDRFDRVVIGNTGLPAPMDTDPEIADAVRRYRKDAPTPTLPEVFAAISTGDPERGPVNFAHWQKWCWENEDLPVGFSVASTVDGRVLSDDEIAAYDAPFPEPAYKMGPRAMPSQVPTLSDDPSVPANLRAWETFRQWEKPFLLAFTNNDPVTAGGGAPFLAAVPGAANQKHRTIDGGGHFLQEGRGVELAGIISEFVASS